MKRRIAPYVLGALCMNILFVPQMDAGFWDFYESAKNKVSSVWQNNKENIIGLAALGTAGYWAYKKLLIPRAMKPSAIYKSVQPELLETFKVSLRAAPVLIAGACILHRILSENLTSLGDLHYLNPMNDNLSISNQRLNNIVYILGENNAIQDENTELKQQLMLKEMEINQKDEIINEQNNKGSSNGAGATDDVDIKPTNRKPRSGISVEEIIDMAPDRIQVMAKHLKNKKYNKIRRKGFILCGPPGTGKTELMLAMGESANVKVFLLKATELATSYTNQTAKNIAEFFDKVHNALKEGEKAIVFIDEIDAIAKKRVGGPSSAEDEKSVTALLNVLDGVSSSDRIIAIGATNCPESIDSAIKSRLPELKMGYPPRESIVGALKNEWSKVFKKDSKHCLFNEMGLNNFQYKDWSYRDAIDCINSIVDAYDLQKTEGAQDLKQYYKYHKSTLKDKPAKKMIRLIVKAITENKLKQGRSEMIDNLFK